VTVTEPTMTGRTSGGVPLLEVRDLHVFYGNIAAVNGISFAVHPGEIVTLIGSNGAGKSTTLRCISGLIKPRKGSVSLKGENITRLEGHDVVAKGICHSPEGRRIFPKMSVDENLDLGAFLRKDRPASPRTGPECSTCFLGCGRGSTSRRARCLAGSSRCSPWHAP